MKQLICNLKRSQSFEDILIQFEKHFPFIFRQNWSFYWPKVKLINIVWIETDFGDFLSFLETFQKMQNPKNRYPLQKSLQKNKQNLHKNDSSLEKPATLTMESMVFLPMLDSARVWSKKEEESAGQERISALRWTGTYTFAADGNRVMSLIK